MSILDRSNQTVRYLVHSFHPSIRWMCWVQLLLCAVCVTYAGTLLVIVTMGGGQMEAPAGIAMASRGTPAAPWLSDAISAGFMLTLLPLVWAVVRVARLLVGHHVPSSRRQHMRCQYCGYDLSGLAPVTECPECGYVHLQRLVESFWARHILTGYHYQRDPDSVPTGPSLKRIRWSVIGAMVLLFSLFGISYFALSMQDVARWAWEYRAAQATHLLIGALAFAGVALLDFLPLAWRPSRLPKGSSDQAPSHWDEDVAIPSRRAWEALQREREATSGVVAGAEVARCKSRTLDVS